MGRPPEAPLRREPMTAAADGLAGQAPPARTRLTRARPPWPDRRERSTRAIGSQRTLACRPLGSALRSLIVNGTSTLTVDPAVVTVAISGTAEGQARPAQRRLERGRRRRGGAGGSGGAGQDVLRCQPALHDDRSLEARGRARRIHLRHVARAALAREGDPVPVRAGALEPRRLDGPAAAEDGPYEVRGARPCLGDHCRRTRPDEAGGVVVDPLLRDVERALRQPRLRVAARVAQVVQEHDRVPGQLHLGGDRRLAEVLVLVIAAAGGRIEAEAVLRDRIQRIAVATRPAIPVAHVDDERGALEGVLDGGPGRVWASRARPRPGCTAGRSWPPSGPARDSRSWRRRPVRR